MAKRKSETWSQLPDYKIEALARSFLPAIRAYYESKEGREAYAAWRQGQKKRQGYGQNRLLKSQAE